MNNNQPASSKKPIIIFIAIIVIAGIYYFYSLGNSNTDPNSPTQQVNTVSADTQLAGIRVLSLLNQVSSLKIDKSLFDSPAFNSLVDRTIEIPEQNVGRPNPFEPIGGYVADKTTIPTPSIAPIKKTH